MLKRLFGLAALLIAAPALSQGVVSPSAADVAAQLSTMQAQVDAANQAATSASSTASAAQSSVTTLGNQVVKSVNGITPATGGALSLTLPTIPDMTPYAKTTDVSSSITSSINSAMTGVVKSVNGNTPNASGAATLALPTASTTAPPCIGDTSSAGTAGTMLYAPYNHTHCSKARRIIATTATDGSYTFNYSATPFTNPPVCTATADVPTGTTDVINAQIIDTPTTTSMKVLVNRTQKSVASLIGLTVLSIPASPGATVVHIICLEP